MGRAAGPALHDNRRVERLGPLHDASFRKLFAAQVVALIGSGLATVAMTLLAYDLAAGNAAAVLGTALACKMVAYVVFAPIAGGLSHRFRRKGFLVAMDLVRAVLVLAMPFATEAWHLYLLIFLLSVFSAGFKPVYAATIPDILPEERRYTRALAMSRLAYDLENVLSPTLAAIALLYVSYTGLFVGNAVAFLVSAALILATLLPTTRPVSRPGAIADEISFGIRSYLKTPRLRGLLALYMGVASASAMIIVNTVNYVRDYLGGTESDVAIALAASGGGSMVAAIGLPKVLDRIDDRPVMLSGALVMAAGLGLLATGPAHPWVWPVWFLIGFGWSLVQTPAGRVVNRSSAPADRPAYFSAQFALSHACWLVSYPVAGQLGTHLGVPATALALGFGVLVFAALATSLWPKHDPEVLPHTHAELVHDHLHGHGPDDHHDHEARGADEPHSHKHRHRATRHAHRFVIDDHHTHWPRPG
ncbi:MAG: MFS transporter [Gammaproteobacteria bacterium]|nr:MFS transporter [Gammaproteobacteria bacterium]